MSNRFLNFRLSKIKNNSKKILKKNIIHIKNYIEKKPILKNKVLKVLKYFPKIEHRLRRIGQNIPEIVQEQGYLNYIAGYDNLNSRSKKIYDTLKEYSKSYDEEIL